ncbi:hypothetical protein [Streptomyces sp. NPDC002164]|uniref:hypothetical protein n=1 Tax=unclassified Streptomyces TaxID=2593676 RepID=UPI0036D089B4
MVCKVVGLLVGLCAVLFSDHAAEAGAGRCEVVFEAVDACFQGVVLVGGFLELAGQLIAVAGEAVDAGGQLWGVEGVELLAKLVA